MLKIYTPDNISLNKELVEVPWYKYFNTYKITKFFDETDNNIVKDVENTSLINSETIYGKFSDMPIAIGNLSEGCKTLLCINHAIKVNTIDNYIFDITSCGGNAIAYLANVMTKNVDVHVVIDHINFGYIKDCKVEVNNIQCNGVAELIKVLYQVRNEVTYD